MRLHRLALTGIGPFRGTHEIDFDDLSASGLFLIEGATGSGKTTIIDALVYALFGVVSAGDDESTRLRIRSDFCAEADPTGVTCDFSVDGRTFRIARVPANFRDPDEPQRRAASKGPRQVLTEFVDGGDPVVRTIRGEVNERIAEILGMSAAQFRQLVVLPQGRFAELLRQTPHERLRSLEPLLEDGFIARVQADLDQEGRQAKARRAAAEAAVTAALDELRGRLRSWLEGTPREVHFHEDDISDEVRHQRVADILAALATEAERTRAARDEQAEVVVTIRQQAAEAKEAWSILIAVERATTAVAESQKSVEEEDRGLTEQDAELRLRELRQLVGSLETHAAWERQASVRQAERAEHEAEAAELRRRIDRIDAERAPLPAQKDRLDAARLAARERAASAEAAVKEEERLTSLIHQAVSLREARSEATRLDSRVEHARLAEARAEEEVRLHEARRLDLLHRRQEAAAVSLAANLVDGDACPVCGSTEHPSPARGTDAETFITEADIDAATAAVNAARQAAGSARRLTADVVTAQNLHAQEVARLVGAVGDQEVAVIRERLDEARVARSAAEAADLEAARIEAELSALRARSVQLDRSRAEAAERLTQVETTVANQLANEDTRRAEIRGVIGDAESASTLLHQTMSRAAALENLTQAWAKLAATTSRVTPKLAASSAEEALDAARAKEEASAAADALLTELTEAAARASSTLADVQPLAHTLHQAIDDRRKVQAETTVPIELAALVTADNRLRLPLRGYALQRRFSDVLAAATRHLDRMSEGRFAFELSEHAVGAGQSGLGITVLDVWSGHGRDPKSLSGGETFYASLALALGLADVVRGEAGGTALETLFVDEGFGSLDQDTLGGVLDQLDALRAGNRVVGVVSHVTEMRESIPDRLEVRRTHDKTSEIRRASA